MPEKEDLFKAQRFLIIQTAYIGDVVLATSLIEKLSSINSNWQLDILEDVFGDPINSEMELYSTMPDEAKNTSTEENDRIKHCSRCHRCCAIEYAQ